MTTATTPILALLLLLLLYYINSPWQEVLCKRCMFTVCVGGIFASGKGTCFDKRHSWDIFCNVIGLSGERVPRLWLKPLSWMTIQSKNTIMVHCIEIAILSYDSCIVFVISQFKHNPHLLLWFSIFNMFLYFSQKNTYFKHSLFFRETIVFWTFCFAMAFSIF